MKNTFTNICIYTIGFAIIFSQLQYIGIKEWCIVTVGGCVIVFGAINSVNKSNDNK